MKLSTLVFVAIWLGFTACDKDNTTCWECYEIAISNEINICNNPDQIESGDPENLQIVCSDDERNQYLIDHPPSNITLEKDCDGTTLFPIVTRSAICDEVK